MTAANERIRGAYVIGADGGRSQIARDLELPFEGQMDVAGSMNIVFSADLSAKVAHRPSVLYWVLQPGSDIGGKIISPGRPQRLPGTEFTRLQ